MEFDPDATTAVVIPVHNGINHLPKTLAVLRQFEYPSANVVVVDDGSTDGTSEYLRTEPRVVTIGGNGSLWWTGAVDVGVRAALARGCEVVILWNDDNVDASSDGLGLLVETVRESRGCASPVILLPSHHPAGRDVIFHAGGMIDWPNGGLGLRLQNEAYVPSDEVIPVSWLPGQALAIHESVFREVAAFDAKGFPQYRGDADFTMRAVNGGRTCSVVHACWVRNDRDRTGLHFGRRVGPIDAVRGLGSRRSNYQLTNVVRFAWRHCPRRDLVPHLAMLYSKYFWACSKTWVRQDPSRI
jgi:GT2 family glycosyltransferase